MIAAEAAKNTAVAQLKSAKRIERASAVPMSVTKVAAMMSLPSSVALSPVSTSTA